MCPSPPDERILFLETSEEKPSAARVDGILMDYENMGVLSKIRGLLFGRFGHTAPQFVLPVGCLARIDSARRAFEITEAAVL